MALNFINFLFSLSLASRVHVKNTLACNCICMALIKIMNNISGFTQITGTIKSFPGSAMPIVLLK